MALPAWPPRDWRAFIALAASIAGAAVLTGFAAWLVWILWRGGWPDSTAPARIDALAKALLLILAIIGAVLISMGMVINRRTVKGSFGTAMFEATGGDDDSTSAVAAVTTTTTVSAAPAAPTAAPAADTGDKA